jgi:hypothetical protein
MTGLYELVSLRRDVARHGLKAGDVGMVIDSYEGGKGYIVEFGDAEGNTLAVLTLNSEDVEPLKSSQILRVRDFIEHT